METNVKAVELRELWRRYKVDGDEKARERLVVAYSPAGQVHRRPDGVRAARRTSRSPT